MNAIPTMAGEPLRTPGSEGRERLLSQRGEPLFIAGWERSLFIHFEVDAGRLQRDVPFPLDLRAGRAYVSLVAFTMRDMRFSFGGKPLAWLLKPVATHFFLNMRTYVKQAGEPGIYFLTEWLSNCLSVKLGPLLYGLPYRHAKINYQHQHEMGRLTGTVENSRQCFAYQANCNSDEFGPCQTGSLDEFLVERYTAYTAHHTARRFFRIWHPPWPQAKAHIEIQEKALLCKAWPWFAEAQLIGAKYSPGFSEVWMGRAHRIR